MSGFSSQSTSPIVSAPHQDFRAAKPELGDSFLLDLQNVVIVPGLGSAYESFVVSASKQFLMKGNAIALFTDPTGFKNLTSWSCGRWRWL
jgi:hypothetical protein